MDDEMRPIKELGKDLIRDLKSDWTSINSFSLREEENANSLPISLKETVDIEFIMKSVYRWEEINERI